LAYKLIKMPMKDTYFDPNNGLLTRSKILDYLKSPEYFNRKHLLGQIPHEDKDCFIIGGMVDSLLTKDPSERSLQVARDENGKAKRRMPKLVAEYAEQGITLITETTETEILELAVAVDNSAIWKFLMTHKCHWQSILEMPLPKNKHFKSIAGKPDVFYIEGDTCSLIDLKTTKTVDHTKYFYNALGYKYEWQMALYGKLIRHNFPKVKHVIYQHFAVEKSKDIHNVELFEFPKDMVEDCLPEIKKVIDTIIADKEFKKYDPKWNKPVMLGQGKVMTEEEFEEE